MTTHYAVLLHDTVIGTRSSASRHVDGTGKFGPYTHAVVGGGVPTVLSYHGTEAAARTAARTGPAARTLGVQVVPVIITPKRLTVAVAGA